MTSRFLSHHAAVRIIGAVAASHRNLPADTLINLGRFYRLRHRKRENIGGLLIGVDHLHRPAGSLRADVDKDLNLTGTDERCSARRNRVSHSQAGQGDTGSENKAAAAD